MSSAIPSFCEIRDHRLRGVVSWCTCHAATGMGARTAQIESRGRHAVAGISQHRARRKELVERERTVEDVAIRQPEDALQIERREALPGDHAGFEAGRVGLDRIDYQIRDSFAVVLP